MGRAVIRALWFMAVANASLLGAMQVLSAWGSGSPAQEMVAGKPEERRTKPIAVPIFVNGAVDGYAILQFAYGLTPREAQKQGAFIDSAIADATFRVFLADKRFGNRAVDRIDLGEAARVITADVNKALKAEALAALLIVDIKYVRNESARR